MVALPAARARETAYDVGASYLGSPNAVDRQVSQAVRVRASRTAVIMVTGGDREMNADDAGPPHVDHLLSKPPRLFELRAVLARCIATR